MKTKKKKLHKKSSKDVKKKYKLLKLPSPIVVKIFPSIPNTRLRLILKEEPLNSDTCKELQKVLKLEVDLTDSKIQITNKFYRYKWEFRVRNKKVFKRALSTYQEKNPDTNIFSEDIRPVGSMIQYVGYVVGSLGLLLRFIL